MNNNPTVQDAWNYNAGMGVPVFEQQHGAGGRSHRRRSIAGRGGSAKAWAASGIYAWLDSHFYAELTDYTSAITGGSHPLDSTQANVVHALAPYWRLAYEQRWDRNSLEIGAYGLTAHDQPGNGKPLSGPTDKYRDAALDAQYQFIGEDHLFTALATYIDEHQTLDASVADGLAANVDNDLKTVKLMGEYYYKRKIGGSIGYFSTTGSSDPLLYAAAAVTGSANFSPDTAGYIAEVNYLPWLNVKLQLQYTGYSKFNGGKTNYDGSGRAASDNDTTYLLVWLNY